MLVALRVHPAPEFCVLALSLYTSYASALWGGSNEHEREGTPQHLPEQQGDSSLWVQVASHSSPNQFVAVVGNSTLDFNYYGARC